MDCDTGGDWSPGSEVEWDGGVRTQESQVISDVTLNTALETTTIIQTQTQRPRLTPTLSIFGFNT